MQVNASDPAFFSVRELRAYYRARTLSPVEALQQVFARIDAHEPRVNAFCLLDRDGALASARASESRWMRGTPEGALDGIPVSIKDVILTRGWPTLRGSKTIDPAGPWDEDAPATARVREANAVIFGKTTTPEFGWKGLCDSPLTGITRNPWDTTKTPGGSSGGAAVALALGMGTLALGTDAAGSIRIPASFTGVSGIKATFGRVAAYPISPFGTIANVGPMARTFEDVALLLDVIGRPDVRDWYALPPAAPVAPEIAGGVRGMRIAYSPTLGYARVDPAVAELVARAAQEFEDLGAHVERVDHVCHDPVEALETLWFAGSADVVGAISPERRALLDPGFVAVAGLGEAITRVQYRKAEAARVALGITLQRFFERFDLLLTPTMAIPAFEAGRNVPPQFEGKQWTAWSPFTYPFNLSRQPAASVPCGLTPEGLPVGLQIVGPLNADARVLQAGYAFESRHPFLAPPGAH
ncbi:MAG: amidase [Candidatus Velthaea sp.]